MSDQGYPTFVAALLAALTFIVLVQVHTLIQTEVGEAPGGGVYPLHFGP